MFSKTHITSRGVLAATGLLALTLAVPQAHAENEFEVGGFIGLHAFSGNNEIGVADLPGGTDPVLGELPDALSPSNSPALGARLAYRLTKMFSIEGEAAFIPAKMRDDGDIVSTAEILALAYRIHALAHFSPMEKKLRPFVLLGIGGMSISSSEPDTVYNDEDFVFHGGAGFKYRLGESWGLRADVRALLPPSSANDSVTTDVEIALGLYSVFPHKKVPPPPKDSDGDGMTDDVDQCPEEAEDKDNFQDEDGCPDKDNDADGVLDDNDKCISDPEDKDGFEDSDGCPDKDNDADGVLDTDDKCINEPEDKDGFQDEDGCAELDNDGDKINDDKDQCANEPEDADGFQDEDGCPDPDNDGDGVLDAADKCPSEAETKNGFQDDDGCPDVIPRKLQRFTGAIKGINFQTGKAIIRRSSNRTLNAAVKILQEYPTLRVEISGHTDNRGKAEMNRELSKKRAEAVVKYMVDKGIGADRLIAKGFGPDRPVADNTKKKGRAQNRRVEFKLLSDLVGETPDVTPPTPAPEGGAAPK